MIRSNLLPHLLLTCVVSFASSATAQKPESQPVLLQMIRDDSIHRELGLDSGQIAAIQDALKAVDGPWFRVRIRPVEERVAKIDELTQQLFGSLGSILKPHQLERLEELQNQALGTRMVVRDRTAARLKLDASKREQLYAMYKDTDERVVAIQKQAQKREIEEMAAGKQIAKLQAAERKKFVDSLSNEQQRILSTLTGKPFDFSKVKRTYPAAPEFTSLGASWLQGTDLTLDELKGKVVAVHFYAFQCINCKRNLPHYNGWHKDYADQGLVVIGIQTPETPAERSSKQVAAAMRKDQIEYPVLMDSDAENWKQWSNTMWPTVYLIDKKGFLRRWWQGEMNWKGTPGEKQMRETIEQLLSEDA